jgi:uncharacterized delta-60 repeat protein
LRVTIPTAAPILLSVLAAKSIHFFFGGSAQAYALAVQADGKILAGGYGGVGFGLARYNDDGSLDSSFGSGGLVTTHIARLDEQINAITVQPDGKIVVAGYCDTDTGSWDFALARYHTDGSLDPTFGVNGIIITTFAGRGSDEAYAMALQSDGKIVVAGLSHNFTSTSENFALARYDANGNLDPDFGNGGKVLTDFFSRNDIVTALAIQADGKIVAAGRAGVNSFDSTLVLARYDSNGNLDTGFGTGGKVNAGFNLTLQHASGMVLQKNGKIVVSSSVISALSSSDFALIRLNPSGSLDTGFGSNGLITTDFYGGSEGTSDLVIQADGKLVAAGNGENGSIKIARYQAEYDICLQDENNGNLLRLNSFTGAYQLTNCRKGYTINGSGTVSRSSCKLMLSGNNAAALINSCTQKGSATVYDPASGRTLSVTDNNIANNSCRCN